ncbi:sugar ABC transporter permease [Patescibacteria group bacterium]|nr:sugar ABC transporter permease [Patescibacteria group bacterium]
MKKWTNYLYILPIFILIAVLFIYPLISTIRLSLYNIPFGMAKGIFIGLENYSSLFKDSIFQQGFKNSLIWTLGNLFLQLTIPLGVAILLNKKLKGVNFVRAAVLVPWIVPAVVVAICARWVLLPTIGIVNRFLIQTHIVNTRISFLGSRNLAMPTLIVLNSWKFFPFGTLLILAALQVIPGQLYEVAQIDGASAWQQFVNITFPMLGKMIWFVGFLAFVWNFNIFDLIWLTTQGGPGDSTQILPILI